ncbi:copper uptake system-associated protein [Chitinibacter fontanus]|uniref:Copper uptake system-associated protein n=1 Tax=Chitinibacter fontanus TaxID=1737446 RepID=A0A7D5Z5C2_9NEIS|nr:copper uptake system-associated protein [Chitinibacter fontanus]QLI82321.1 copper uptake system-associated protein [Chitinibacter fontanus]
MRITRKYLGAALFVATLFSANMALADDTSDIIHSLKATWDKADNPLAVKPVVIVEQYAIAGWQQGGRGGRAILQKSSHGWQAQLCAGEITTHLLLQAGVPANHAKRLLTDLNVAEKAMTSKEVAQMSSFEGVIKMDQHSHHPASSSSEHASHH